ncbi:protein kinase domain-containing protein [Allorhizocola rhizosphaerae]|uniref:protein kinase domain-containing protein n=1 Tax=Allorhizocola rhizosphaerae TaxID=1872709 RepID=UPI0013C329FA|nr:protein kinase [Allorhizocola rhizosphaerae]
MQGGFVVPGYTLVRRLDDSGGQATVHLGRSLAPPHHEAAIKIYHSTLRSRRDRQRFQREVDAMERLAPDPHIIDLYDVGVLDNGQAYLAMRLCPGGSLASLIAERGPMSPAAVISLGETMAEALGRAHRRGVLHRDVKPHNILLAEDGSPVLADFGIVALRHEISATTGRWTASYAAPELFHDEPATVKTDIYGLGATLYTMLAGYPPHHEPHRNPSPAELVWRRSSKPARLDGVPTKLMNVLLQALAPNPDERYATADAFAAALREATPGQNEPVERPEPRRRMRVVYTPTVQPGLLAAVLAGLGFTTWWATSLAPAGWAWLWAVLTLLVGVFIGFGRVGLGVTAFVASIGFGLAISVRGYDSSPFGSIGWILAAFAVGALFGVWGRSTSALRLRWFALRARLGTRRWFGQPSVRGEFTELESMPAVRFLRLASGTCHYAVTCGNSVALVRLASWPEGDYIASNDSVRRDGSLWPQGGAELERARRGLSIVDGVPRRRVFLAVDTAGKVIRRDLRDDLTICHASDLAPAIRQWLSTEPAELNLELLSRLTQLTHHL